MFRELVDVVSRALLLGGLSALLLALGGALGCTPLVTDQGPTVQLDPDVDDRLGGTGVESGDVRGASEQISRALAGMRHERERPRIAVAPVQNLSRFRIDPGLLKNRLTHDLVQRARGRFELIPLDDDTPSAHADYVLRTELRSLTKDNGVSTSDYLQYAFLLERPTDGAVLWSGMYETKRKSDVDVIYQ
ncbi:MAG: hypothetical protein IT382_03730 [Deltaproteobacteria bacterium]|jgi:hypothetical protein|nr:hypothetical protein [Deltaproteobacteria bacterium]